MESQINLKNEILHNHLSQKSTKKKLKETKNNHVTPLISTLNNIIKWLVPILLTVIGVLAFSFESKWDMLRTFKYSIAIFAISFLFVYSINFYLLHSKLDKMKIDICDELEDSLNTLTTLNTKDIECLKKIAEEKENFRQDIIDVNIKNQELNNENDTLNSKLRDKDTELMDITSKYKNERVNHRKTQKNLEETEKKATEFFMMLPQETRNAYEQAWIKERESRKLIRNQVDEETKESAERVSECFIENIENTGNTHEIGGNKNDTDKK